MRVLRWFGIAVLTAGLGLALGLAGAQEEPGARPPRPPIAIGGNLHGVVTTASGAPLAGAIVSAIPIDLRGPQPPPGSPPVPIPAPGEPRVDGPAGSPREPLVQPEGREGQREAPGPERPNRGGTDADTGVDGRIAPGMPRPLFEARTDRQGRFRMHLPFGRYLVRISAPGFHAVFYGGTPTRSEATEVVLDGARQSVEVVVALEPVSTLAGRVTVGKTGVAVSEGEAVAERRSPGGKFRRSGALKPDGSYLIEGLEPGVYLVQILARGYLTALYIGGDENGRVRVEAGDRIAGIDVEVSEGLAISGRVWDEEGGPVGGVSLVAWPAVGEGRRQQAQTAADGLYRLSGLTAGSYFVTAGKPGYGRAFYEGVDRPDEARPVQVTPEVEPTEIDFRLKPVGTIFGRVTARAGDGPVGGAVVIAEPRAGKERRRALTEADGTYLISDLPTGDYLVQARAEGYVTQFYSEALKREDAEAVRVLADAHTTGIDVALGRLSTVSGQVTDRDGTPVPGAGVMLVAKPERGVSPPAPPGAVDRPRPEPRPPGGTVPPPPDRRVHSAETDEDGRFRVEDVPPGTYLLQAGAIGFVGRFYTVGEGTPPAEIEIGVEQAMTGIDVTLPRLGMISGQVTAGDGELLEGLEVVAEPVRPTGPGGPALPVDRVPAVSVTRGPVPGPPAPPSDFPGPFPRQEIRAEILDPEEGTYRIVGLPEGTYVVRASARGSIASWYSGAEHAEAAEKLEVGVDEVLPQIDFELRRGGLISGTVLADGTGRPISSAFVTAQRVGQTGIWRAETDRRGVFELSGLPDGRYLIRAEARGFVGEFYEDTPKPDRAVPVVIGSEKTVLDLLFGLDRRSPADFDGDGDVDFADLIVLLQRMMAASQGQAEPPFDLNEDGQVDLGDLLTLVQLMRGAGKVAIGSGGVAWQGLEGAPDEVRVGLVAESIPVSQGYFVQVTYDPEEAAFVGAEESLEGIFSGGTFLVHEEEGAVLIAGGNPEGNGGGGNGLLARLRFRPLGGATGVTVEAEVGLALARGGGFAPLHLPEARRLEVSPGAFRLLQNVPNPFNPITAIAFELPDEAEVELAVYNLVGQRVRTLVHQVKSAGRYRVEWDARDDMGRDVSSGVYFYHLKAEAFSATRRMMLLR